MRSTVVHFESVSDNVPVANVRLWVDLPAEQPSRPRSIVAIITRVKNATTIGRIDAIYWYTRHHNRTPVAQSTAPSKALYIYDDGVGSADVSQLTEPTLHV